VYQVYTGLRLVVHPRQCRTNSIGKRIGMVKWQTLAADAVDQIYDIVRYYVPRVFVFFFFPEHVAYLSAFTRCCKRGLEPIFPTFGGILKRWPYIHLKKQLTTTRFVLNNTDQVIKTLEFVVLQQYFTQT
jgi:hypothetical protein